jgi:ribose 5-phosphate isomerase B
MINSSLLPSLLTGEKSMKIAVTSDEPYPIHSFVLEWLQQQGHELVLFGALKSSQEESWVKSAWEAAHAIKEGRCDEGIFFCWTGTGISITANKLPGIRAALCTDAETARGARLWNHANVLALSNRLLSQGVAKEILNAWFETFDRAKGVKGVTELIDFEEYRER